MADLQMGVVESRFADIIWQNEPISSTERQSGVWECCGVLWLFV